jgi:hypothetical protein
MGLIRTPAPVGRIKGEFARASPEMAEEELPPDAVGVATNGAFA